MPVRQTWTALAGVLLLPGLLAGCGPRKAEAGSAASFIEMGDNMRTNGDMQAAASFYSNAAQRDPTATTPLVRLGDIRRAEGDPERAEASYRAALRASPTDRAAATGLASSVLAQGRGPEAVTLLEPLATGSSDPQLLANYGVALDMSGRQADAQAVYRRGLQKTPGNAPLNANLALSLAVSGDTAAALSSMDVAEMLAGDQGWATADKVLLLAYAGREADARALGAGRVGDGDLETLLARGRQARLATTPAARAAALGVMGSQSPVAVTESQTSPEPAERATTRRRRRPSRERAAQERASQEAAPEPSAQARTPRTPPRPTASPESPPSSAPPRP